MTTAAGLFFLIGWLGETFLGLPRGIAIVFYVLAYLAGGYDIVLESIPPLLKLKFSTDVLMIFAAIARPCWASGARVHSCSFCLAWVMPVSTMR